MDVRIEDRWKRRLQPEFNKPYFEKLVAFVRQEYARYTVYPPGHLLFYAFDTCPFDKVKVVMIGQGPVIMNQGNIMGYVSPCWMGCLFLRL